VCGVAVHRYTHVAWGEGLGWYAGGTVMYATQAPAGSSDDDDDNKSNSKDDDDSAPLSQTTVIAMSVVFSFVAGGVLTGLVMWFWMSHANKDPLLANTK
jgi:hypothetical protein